MIPNLFQPKNSKGQNQFRDPVLYYTKTILVLFSKTRKSTGTAGVNISQREVK